MIKIINILLLFLIACTSVDRRYFRESMKKNAEIILDQHQIGNTKLSLYDKRTLDTTLIYLHKNQKPTLKMKFNEALKSIENENYENAYKKLKVIYESIEPDNEFYNLVNYYIGECELYLNRIDEASKKFQEVINNNDNSEAIIERSFIRLGQINCLRKQANEAMFYFKKLKENYPGSLYLRFAKCPEIE